MAQSITLKIAGMEYSLMAASPEQEKLMRFAAEDINKLMARYDEKFPDRPLVDKLAFVTLNQVMAKFSAQMQVRSYDAEVEALNTDIVNYLKNI